MHMVSAVCILFLQKSIRISAHTYYLWIKYTIFFSVISKSLLNISVMKQGIVTFVILILSVCSAYPNFSADNAIKKSGSGMNIFIFNSLGGKKLQFTSLSSLPNPLLVTKYSLSGATSTVPASDINIIDSYSFEIINLEGNYGYELNSNVAWVIDYSAHMPVFNSLTSAPADYESCNGNVLLTIDKTGSPLQYRTLGGKIETISHEYLLTYENLLWNQELLSFEDIESKIEIQVSGDSYTLDKSRPLKETNFTIHDSFAEYFGISNSITTDESLAPSIIDEQYIAEIITDSINPTLTNETYSAPLEVNFRAYANEPAANFYRWRIYYEDDEKINWQYQYYDKEITHTFTQAGKYLVELVVGNNENQACEKTRNIEFSISESMLELPNFFSPVGSPGINDIYKVKHKSLVKFQATVFNRWGNKIYEWTNPDEGWDGKYKGKHVSPGVYFVVVIATGSEGRKYKKSSDINILRGK